jgi:hypothetical protein
MTLPRREREGGVGDGDGDVDGNRDQPIEVLMDAPVYINLLSQPRGADQAAYAHTVKAPAPSLSFRGGCDT